MFSIDTFDQAIRSYYETANLDVKAIERREFMFSNNDRHRAFANEDELRAYAMKKSPTAITHSLARYFDPARREPFGTKDEDPSTHMKWGMADKGYSGIDIGFDIDYDHLPNITSYRHGIEQARENATRLLDFLVKDLGVGHEHISIRFSGHRGFHMVVTDESLLSMGADERANIENYVRGHDVHLSGFMYVSNNKGVWANKQGQFEYRLYPSNVPGWGGRFTQTFIEMVNEYHSQPDEEHQRRILEAWTPIHHGAIKESTFKRPTFTSENRVSITDGVYKQIHDFMTNEYALTQLSKDWRLSHWASASGLKSSGLKHLIRMVIQQSQLRKGVEADAITKDLNRQLRLPGSLHTTSGMPCIEITFEMLNNLDLMFEHIRNTVGTDMVEIEVKNEVFAHVLDRQVAPGSYTVPRYEAYSIMCMDLKEEAKKNEATPTSEEADAAE